MQLQAELARFHQDLQEKTTQEEQLRQQITEKEEKTRKTLLAAKQKIAQLAGIVILLFCPQKFSFISMEKPLDRMLEKYGLHHILLKVFSRPNATGIVLKFEI